MFAALATASGLIRAQGVLWAKDVLQSARWISTTGELIPDKSDGMQAVCLVAHAGEQH